MLVPIYLGLCGVVETDAGHRAATALIARTAALSIGVAAVHTGAMITAGAALAFGVYRWLGLRFLSKSWFDLDVIWALSLVLVGAIGVFSAL
ncbi:MAG: hypothetical protein E5Y59_21050 [Mesorhizobium sp.]|nr:MAG: hypothetical protein E5Y59_21050 [Mesorhizobium sp.]